MENNFGDLKVSIERRKIYAGFAILLSLAAGVSLLQIPQEESRSEFNRQDVMFMNMMIVHHDQAITMSEMADNRTDNQNIIGLAENISEAQSAENRQMREWMNELGYDTGNHHAMAGMATEQEMQKLRNSSGEEFDKLFAELMIEHHRGGIEMAKNFRQAGRHSELKEMQTAMIETQQKEISKMENWQKQGF